MKFLVIDDNPDDRELIIREIKREFPDGEFNEIITQKDFDESLNRGGIDVVITDYRLHWTDGLQVLRDTRDKFANIPVVMITDSGSEEIAVEGMKLGLSDYVLKRNMRRLPFAVQESLERIRLRDIADTLQEALLTIPEKIDGIRFAHLYRSATEIARVGGDFFDVFELEHGRVGIIVGDVSGKGLEAATLTALTKNAIRAYAYEYNSPALIMEKTNEVIRKAVGLTTFITLVLAILDTREGKLTYTNAGHPPPILKRKKGGISLLGHTSIVIGALAGVEYEEASEVLEQGDILIFYSDGVTEAKRGAELFGEERLINVVEGLEAPRAEELPNKIFQEVTAYTGGKLQDDMVILCLTPAT